MVESTRPDLPSLLGTLLVACHCLVGDEEEDEESSLALIGESLSLFELGFVQTRLTLPSFGFDLAQE